MNKPLHSLSRRTGQRGLSLVEVMVSLAIGLVVVGAVFANYINNSVGSAQTAALAQVTEDASLALGILRNHIAMADFSQPIGATTNGLTRRLDGQLNLVGCDAGFNTGKLDDANPTNVVCGTGGAPGSSAVLVRYEADEDSTPTATDSSTGLTGPMDCSGNTLPVIADPAHGNHYIADNRFYVNNSQTTPALMCLGIGSNAPATPLVENVRELHITYGVAPIDVTTHRAGNITGYVKAEVLGAPGTLPAPDITSAWARVVSARICVVVSSAENVLDKATPYRNCAGAVVTPPDADHRIYRAFTSTVVLNNRVKSTVDTTTNPDTSASGT